MSVTAASTSGGSLNRAWNNSSLLENWVFAASPDTSVASFSTLAALVLLLLGYPDRARRLGQEAVELARQGDPYSLALVPTF